MATTKKAAAPAPAAAPGPAAAPAPAAAVAPAKKTPAPAPAAAVAPAKKKNKVNAFSPSKVQDTKIVDADNKTVGHIRVKPSGVLWAPANSKVWYGLSLDQLDTLAKTEGKKQKK